MKRSRLPLTALRSFESAGRLLSFSDAAAELFVSQAAISRQIRELEEMLGVKLFERLHRSVALTEKGAVLLAEVTAGFDRIDGALANVREDLLSNVVRVSSEPTFASLWLLPRLGEFRQAHPEIEIVVEADYRVTEFRNGAADLAIRHGLARQEWPRVEAWFLQKVACTPVVSPGLAQRLSFPSPEAVFSVDLIHEENRALWNRWLALAKLDKANAQKGPVFPDGAFTLNAVRQGQGAALGDINLLSREIAAGELVAPFALCVECGAYYLVAPNLKRLRKPAAQFADWLVEAINANVKAT